VKPSPPSVTHVSDSETTLAFQLKWFLTGLSVEQLAVARAMVLAWLGLLEQHQRWARAAQDGPVDGGDVS
jgi:hypothetical protein